MIQSLSGMYESTKRKFWVDFDDMVQNISMNEKRSLSLPPSLALSIYMYECVCMYKNRQAKTNEKDVVKRIKDKIRTF